eukprot:6455378-Amphidinium_carterae.1
MTPSKKEFEWPAATNCKSSGLPKFLLQREILESAEAIITQFESSLDSHFSSHAWPSLSLQE